MGGGGGARRLRGRRQRRIGGTPVPVAAHARVPDGAQRGGAAGDLASTSARSELPAGVPVGRTPHRPPAGVHRHRAAPRARSKCRRSRGRDARCPRERRARGRDPALVGRTGPARQRLGLQDRSSASRGRTSMDAAGFLGRGLADGRARRAAVRVPAPGARPRHLPRAVCGPLGERAAGHPRRLRLRSGLESPARAERRLLADHLEQALPALRQRQARANRRYPSAGARRGRLDHRAEDLGGRPCRRRGARSGRGGLPVRGSALLRPGRWRHDDSCLRAGGAWHPPRRRAPHARARAANVERCREVRMGGAAARHGDGCPVRGPLREDRADRPRRFAAATAYGRPGGDRARTGGPEGPRPSR